MNREKRCPINHCNRPQGIGTWASVVVGRDGSEQVIPVCEEHWQALRGVQPMKLMPPNPGLTSHPRSAASDVG